MENSIEYISKNIVLISISSFTILTIGKIGYNYTQDLISKLNNIKNINSSIFSIKI